MTMAKDLKPGDKVEWDTSQGKTDGVVVRKETRTARVKGHTAEATADDPQYRVRSRKSGKEAIHRPEELRKKS
jgi:hypothetical protein